MRGEPRTTAALATLPALDGLRAVGALAVVLTHVTFQTGQATRGTGGALLARLDVGVAVFFALSGFLLYRPHAVALRRGSPTPSRWRYSVRRVSRIMPGYWAALAVVAVASPAPAGRVLTHLWLGQTYTGALFPAFTQTWSLCTEAAFYLCLPLVAAAIRRAVARYGPAAQPWVLTGLVTLGYGYLAAAHGLGLPDRTLLWLPGHLDWFVAGMALAAVSAQGSAGTGRLGSWARQLADWPGTCWAAAGVLLLFAATPLAGPLTLAPVPDLAAVVKEVLYAAIAVLLLVPAALGPADRGLGSLLAHPVSRYLGRISYGIFLWHLLVLRGVFAITGWGTFSGHLWPVAVLTTFGAVAVASVSWLLVEGPALRLGDRLTGATAARSGRGAAEGREPAIKASTGDPSGRPPVGSEADRGERHRTGGE